MNTRKDLVKLGSLSEETAQPMQAWKKDTKRI